MIHLTAQRLAVAGFLLCMVAGSHQASAGWNANIEKDDFGEAHVGVALTESGGRALGLRCENGRVPALIFATRELWSDRLSKLPVKLLIKVDDGDAENLKASLESYPMMLGFAQQLGVRAIATGDHLIPLLEAIAKAKTRVAVAVEIAGQRFENTRFSPRGSRSAFKKIWEYCGSPSGQNIKPEM
jgi:hypothetical protein